MMCRFLRACGFTGKTCERDRKPSSVVDDHLSRPDVTAQAQAIARARRAAAYALIASCTRWGLHHGQVAKPRVSSCLAFPPLLRAAGARGGISLLHSPWSRLHRPLTGTLPYGARTFLIPFGTRSPGHLAQRRSYLFRSVLSRVQARAPQLFSPDT